MYDIFKHDGIPLSLVSKFIDLPFIVCLSIRKAAFEIAEEGSKAPSILHTEDKCFVAEYVQDVPEAYKE